MMTFVHSYAVQCHRRRVEINSLVEGTLGLGGKPRGMSPVTSGEVEKGGMGSDPVVPGYKRSPATGTWGVRH
jgi:hypothetical protein